MDLHEAAKLGSIDGIESAIAEGFDVNAPDNRRRTPIWLAVSNGHADACRNLLARGARTEGHTSSILELAVRGGRIDVVRLIWSHCEVERNHHCLENAISLGFHEIADFLVGTRIFGYQHSDASHIDMLKKGGFSRRGDSAFQHWERFIFVRHSKKLHLHGIFFDYALLLATKADRNMGLRLVNLLLGGERPLADVNCMIKIGEEIETPLTNAAEKGNLEILAT
jgi:hypothetical protein